MYTVLVIDLICFYFELEKYKDTMMEIQTNNWLFSVVVIRKQIRQDESVFIFLLKVCKAIVFVNAFL